MSEFWAPVVIVFSCWFMAAVSEVVLVLTLITYFRERPRARRKPGRILLGSGEPGWVDKGNMGIGSAMPTTPKLDWGRGRFLNIPVGPNAPGVMGYTALSGRPEISEPIRNENGQIIGWREKEEP